MPLNKIFTAVMHYDGENVYICFFYNGFRQCDPQMSAKKQLFELGKDTGL